jgi:hypothetical protein
LSRSRFIDDDRGAIMAESALILIVLLFFLLLAPAVWRIWITDQYARAEARFPPAIPDLGRYERIGSKLDGYKSFSNHAVQGWQWRHVRYSAGPGWFRGEMNLARYDAAIRSPWTWLGYPFIPTQDFRSEPAAVRKWYKEAYEQTLSKRMVDGLKLDKKPL